MAHQHSFLFVLPTLNNAICLISMHAPALLPETLFFVLILKHRSNLSPSNRADKMKKNNECKSFFIITASQGIYEN